jgi:hypothetical protein
MNNIEQLQNSVELLKQALAFYANKDNYVAKHNQNNVLFSFIEMDNGVQARFALEKLEQMENLYKEAEEDYTKDISDKDVLNAIEDFKRSAENFLSK